LGTIQAEGGEIESVEELCYLGSEVSRDSSCDKEIKIRLWQTNATLEGSQMFGKAKALNRR